MTPDQMFAAANPVAMLGWIVLAAAVLLKRPVWRDLIAGRIFPVAFSLVYSALIVFFWTKAEGGFGSLADVQKLFASPWLLVAGWIHYLAFDLFVGAHIAREAEAANIPRVVILLLLPVTFLFGPMGLVAFEVLRLAFRRTATA